MYTVLRYSQPNDSTACVTVQLYVRLWPFLAAHISVFALVGGILGAVSSEL